MPYILMLDFRCFEVYQYKAFQYVVIKDEVNEVVAFFSVDMLLPGYERKSLSHLE